MIACIGLIIAIYTVVRMVSFCLREAPRAEHPIVRVLAALGIVATLVLAYSLVDSGQEADRGLSFSDLGGGGTAHADPPARQTRPPEPIKTPEALQTPRPLPTLPLGEALRDESGLEIAVLGGSVRTMEMIQSNAKVLYVEVFIRAGGREGASIRADQFVVQEPGGGQVRPAPSMQTNMNGLLPWDISVMKLGLVRGYLAYSVTASSTEGMRLVYQDRAGAALAVFDLGKR